MHIPCRYRVALVIAFCLPAFSVGCGSLGPPLIAYNDNISGEPVCLDIWTPVHVGTGYLLGEKIDDNSFIPTAGMLVAWELGEPRYWPGWNESELNQECDVLVGMAGWLLESMLDE